MAVLLASVVSVLVAATAAGRTTPWPQFMSRGLGQGDYYGERDSFNARETSSAASGSDTNLAAARAPSPLPSRFHRHFKRGMHLRLMMKVDTAAVAGLYQREIS